MKLLLAGEGLLALNVDVNDWPPCSQASGVGPNDITGSLGSQTHREHIVGHLGLRKHMS